MSDPSVYKPRLEQAVARLAGEGLTLCQGTQDGDLVHWMIGPRPVAFFALVAKRSGCSVEHVHQVITNRQVVWPCFDLYFGVWDWRVCRAAMEVLREYDDCLYWIEEAACTRRAKLSLSAIRCLAANGHIETKRRGRHTLYLRKNLGLLPGEYRPSRKATPTGGAACWG